jgi:hypothetical protein
MDIHLKIMIWWFAITFGLWVATRIHYTFTKSNYNWKYFTEEYSYFGAGYLVSLKLGFIAWGVYGLINLSIWWFN